MSQGSSRTGSILLRALLVLLAVYVVLAFATGRPLVALGAELATVVVLWGLYVVRFASVAPGALWPEVLTFAVKDRLRPRTGVVVFTGSSTIGHWTSLERDFAPLPVLNRGINGSRINQIAAHADRLVLSHRPQAVVLYAGENDIAGFLGSKKSSPEQVLAAFRSFCERVHSRMPEVPVHFISIKPATGHREFWPAFEKANQLVREHCASNARLHFIDVAPALLTADGQPRSDIFEFDGVHLNEAGYRILSSVVKPQLALVPVVQTSVDTKYLDC